MFVFVFAFPFQLYTQFDQIGSVYSLVRAMIYDFNVFWCLLPKMLIRRQIYVHPRSCMITDWTDHWSHMCCAIILILIHLFLFIYCFCFHIYWYYLFITLQRLFVCPSVGFYGRLFVLVTLSTFSFILTYMNISYSYSHTFIHFRTHTHVQEMWFTIFATATFALLFFFLVFGWKFVLNWSPNSAKKNIK